MCTCFIYSISALGQQLPYQERGGAGRSLYSGPPHPPCSSGAHSVPRPGSARRPGSRTTGRKHCYGGWGQHLRLTTAKVGPCRDGGAGGQGGLASHYVPGGKEGMGPGYSLGPGYRPCHWSPLYHCCSSSSFWGVHPSPSRLVGNLSGGTHRLKGQKGPVLVRVRPLLHLVLVVLLG